MNPPDQFARRRSTSPVARAALLQVVSMSKRQKRRAGFTLLEILIVVVILAILAAAVVPAVGEISEEAKDSALMRDLQLMRAQIELFKAEHEGNPPGWNGLNPMFHMLLYSNEKGDISLVQNDDYPLGPYLPKQEIVNPFSGGSAWKQSNNPAGEIPDESMTNASGQIIGWFYDRNTGRIAANAEGRTADGTPRIQL